MKMVINILLTVFPPDPSRCERDVHALNGTWLIKRFLAKAELAAVGPEIVQNFSNSGTVLQFCGHAGDAAPFIPANLSSSSELRFARSFLVKDTYS
jgi:hypothetical protein